MNFNKEKAKKAADIGVIIGKKIIVEGSLAVAGIAFTAALGTFVAEGIDGVKKMHFDDFINPGLVKR